MQNEHRAKTPHEEVHLFWHSAEELDHGVDARVDRGVSERKIGSERKADESDAGAIDRRLCFDETDCIPKRLHPQWEIAHDLRHDDLLRDDIFPPPLGSFVVGSSADSIVARSK